MEPSGRREGELKGEHRGRVKEYQCSYFTTGEDRKSARAYEFLPLHAYIVCCVKSYEKKKTLINIFS